MAGGQGTRLGHNGPKGTYALDTINGKKYIFEIIIDRLKKAEKQYNVTIPWYVMTSKENHQDTILFLEKNNYFGYNKDKIKFFKQGELPLIDTQGKIILDENAKIKEAADGNGGIYEALSKSGMLQELKQNQIEWNFISGIDNILSNFVDPILLGLTIKENNVIASKSVAKANPQEKVGVFCKMNGHPKVIEYTELPEKMAEEGTKTLSGEDAFKLYDTYGFPIDLTKEILEEEGIDIDEEGFKAAMEVQRQTARKARKATIYMGADATVYESIDPSATSKFVGYEQLEFESNITVLTTEDETVDALSDGERGTIFVDETPFYATSGGQEADHGVIKCGDGEFVVEDVKKMLGGKIGHIGYME